LKEEKTIKPEDQRIIKKLGELLDCELKRFPSLMFFERGYVINQAGAVVGLSLADSKIYDKQLNTISRLLTALTSLTELDLTHNQLTDISALTSLSDLTTLSLGNNYKLTDISALTALTGLKRLFLQGNQLTDISALKSLTDLTELYLGGNRLTDISALASLTGLTKLFLNENQLTDICALASLTGLTELYLNDNQLTDISALRPLTGLTKLDLDGNQLTDISALTSLTGLTGLNLRGSQLTDISALTSLTGLTGLNLSGNQLTDISALTSLTGLTKLGLRNNQLKEISRAFFERDWKVWWEEDYIHDGLNLFGNPLEVPPVQIIQKGRNAVLDYFASLEAGKRKLNELKVLLVGNGGAGKTSLVRRIFGEPFDSKESQTKGIVIRPKWYRVGGRSVKAHFWDFGGQVIMHSSHQFFLSERSLYILVLDGRKEEETEHWLQLIESFGGDSPILVVLNKMDENPGFEVNRRFLQDKYKRILGFHRISCKAGKSNGITGKNGIINGIRKAFEQVEMFGSEWGLSWFKVKDELEKMKKKEEHFIDSTAYQRICEHAGITDTGDQDTLVDYLNDLGVILHFKDLDLADMHVLEPHWVTDAVYRIINSKKLADNHGELKASDLRSILRKRNVDDFSYPTGKHPYILKLMGKFELCYPMSDDHERMLVPDLQDVQEPSMPSFGDSPLKFYCAYSFLPSSVLPRFTVRMHEEILGILRWRTGVVVQNSDFNATAVVKSDKERKRVYIDVYGDEKREYFSCIRREFFRIHDGFRKLDVTQWIPLPDDENEAVSYDNLYGHWRAGKTEYFHGKTRRSYSVSRLLDGIETPEARVAGFLQSRGVKAEDVKGKSPTAIINIYKQYNIGANSRGLQAGEMRGYVEKTDDEAIDELLKDIDTEKLVRELEQRKEK